MKKVLVIIWAICLPLVLLGQIEDNYISATGLSVKNYQGIKLETSGSPLNASLVRTQHNGDSGMANNYGTSLIHGGLRGSYSHSEDMIYVGNKYVGAAAISIRNTTNNRHSIYFSTTQNLELSNYGFYMMDSYEIFHSGNSNNEKKDWKMKDANVAGDIKVSGLVTASEIQVKAKTADFVSEDDYKLRPLDEVEAFVKENKHLPEIPSAKQMEAEGVNVAEMNKLLLQKVEELTLYLIDEHKITNQQATEISHLKKQLSEQNQIIQELSNRLK